MPVAGCFAGLKHLHGTGPAQLCLWQPEPGAKGPSSLPSSHGGLDLGVNLAGNFNYGCLGKGFGGDLYPRGC